MVGDPVTGSGTITSDPVGAGLDGRLRRAWATEKGRRWIVISVVTAVAIIAVAIAVSLFASLAGESQSFRDGYSAGGSAYTAYAEYSQTNITSEQACRDEGSGPGSRPTHDNAAQWIQGCVAGFNLAQSDN